MTRFSRAISPVFRSKNPRSNFFFPFLFSSFCCFLFVLMLYLRNRLFLFLLLFLTFNLCYFSRKAMCILFNFLVLWSEFLPCPEYFTMGTSQVFIPLIRFLLQRLVSRSFPILLRYSFFFFHLGLFDCVRFQYSKYE